MDCMNCMNCNAYIVIHLQKYTVASGIVLKGNAKPTALNHISCVVKLSRLKG